MRGTDVTSFRRVYRLATASELPDKLTLTFEKEAELRYGENPNQPAALYRVEGQSLAELTNIQLVKGGKGGMSATNVMDVTRALEILKYFPNPSVAVMKHLIPCGFATARYGEPTYDQTECYRKARDADTRSAFGSVVVFNDEANVSTANEILTTFVEAVAAPSYAQGVMDILEQKKDLRVFTYANLDKIPKFEGDDTKGLYDFKMLPTGRVVIQKPYLSSIKSIHDLILDPLIKKDGADYVVSRDPLVPEMQDMLTAWYVNLGVRSNGIVMVRNGVTLAVGSGQQERVGAVEQAIVKAHQKEMDRRKMKYDALEGIVDSKERFLKPLQGAVVSSDAFFPFRDSIDLLGREGVTAIIQPGGSI
ncbi:MAG: hypothetical protein AABX72_04535, partial [Nanoarchaeota archaeon]